MTNYLLEQGYKVGLRRIRRLMRPMGIQAIYPKKHLSVLEQTSYIKKYLLKGLNIDHRNQVWSIDITYIPMKKGLYVSNRNHRRLQSFHSRLEPAQHAWRVELHKLNEAVRRHEVPEIINSDQGCQFTCKEWAEACAQYPQMKASIDGRGRAKDNIWIERFWRTIKYEYIYIASRKMARTYIGESRGSLMIITSTVVTRESAVQYQASSTSGRLHGLN